MKNINSLYESRQTIIKLFNDYASIATEAKYKTTLAKGYPSDLLKILKILTSKQMVQRLPIALAHLKSGDTSENLLNEIRKVIYSLY